MKSKIFFCVVLSSLILFPILKAEKLEGSIFPTLEMAEDLWKTLFKVKYGNWKVRFAPQFPPEVKALDGKNIKIQGFLIPLEQKTKHSFFLLSAFPFDQCFYCGKAGPETVIEVTALKAIKHTEKPITITGKLKLNYENPDHLFYIMKDVKLVD